MERRIARNARIRKWLANPIASAVLLAVLVADSLTLPRYWDATAVGLLVRKTLHPMMLVDPGFSAFGPELYVLRGPDGFRVIDPEVESWNELSALLAAGEPPMAECTFADSSDRAGFWAWTMRHDFRGVVLSPLQGDWSEDQLAGARRAVFVESNLTPTTWASVQPWLDLAAGDTRSRRVIWGGVAHNALALVVFAALLYSLTGWRAWFGSRSWSRAARRRARGLCNTCGYDMRGNDSGVCPECGHPSEPRA